MFASGLDRCKIVLCDTELKHLAGHLLPLLLINVNQDQVAQIVQSYL